MAPKLTDVEAYDLLHKAADTLGRAEGSTVRANTALDAARTMLRLMQMALLQASEQNSDHVAGLIGRESSLPERPD